MITSGWSELLAEVIAVPGVRGALVVSADDGLVVHEAAMDDLPTADVAAFAAALVQRALRTADAAALGAARHLHLAGSDGGLFLAAGPDPLWLVAVTEPAVETGRLRLLLGDLASALG
jgi:predicted regulator of Ras-like GTPase activity (Roadblock/LC7/MglB family)